MKQKFSDEERDEKTSRAQKNFANNQGKYVKHYDENAFLKVVKKLPESTTRPFVTLYYIMKHPGIDLKSKALCVAALGYVALPFDFIPDFIPVLGWLDDLGVVAMALQQLKVWADDPLVQQQVEEFYS